MLFDLRLVRSASLIRTLIDLHRPAANSLGAIGAIGISDPLMTAPSDAPESPDERRYARA
jgi:hypothetical protein